MSRSRQATALRLIALACAFALEQIAFAFATSMVRFNPLLDELPQADSDADVHPSAITARPFRLRVMCAPSFRMRGSVRGAARAHQVAIRTFAATGLSPRWRPEAYERRIRLDLGDRT